MKQFVAAVLAAWYDYLAAAGCEPTAARRAEAACLARLDGGDGG